MGINFIINIMVDVKLEVWEGSFIRFVEEEVGEEEVIGKDFVKVKNFSCLYWVLIEGRGDNWVRGFRMNMLVLVFFIDVWLLFYEMIS